LHLFHRATAILLFLLAEPTTTFAMSTAPTSIKVTVYSDLA